MHKRAETRPSDREVETPATDDTANERDESSRGASFSIVGIGASAGGLEAFTQLLEALPLDTGMGFVLVQHLDPDHVSALAQLLARATPLPVQEITDGEQVLADHVYVIPRDTHLSITGGVLTLGPRQRTRMPHRPIDAFFESLAQDQGERAIGVVLSGTANDGTLGLGAIKAEGGITFAQDDSAKYDSMPRSAVAAGCVDLVLSPARIAKELGRIAKHPFVAGYPLELAPRAEPEDDRAEAMAHQDDDAPPPSGGSGTPPSAAKHARAEADLGDGRSMETTGTAKRARAIDGYKRIISLLYNHTGVDFSLYKSTAIQRRIGRRLVLNRQDTLESYASFLRGNAKELDALYSDVLISVTSFFRNPETFDVLRRDVLPELFARKGDDTVRCWVLGCSTGQEAYSLAMTFVEVAEEAPRIKKIQIFATDLNDALLDKARHGLYGKSLVEGITPQRLRRFFVEQDGGYRITKAVREIVVFARQNLIADPPFSRMDLISCRNLLIYLEPSLQKKAIPTFHYALKPKGFLLLGASESVGSFTDLFAPADKKHKIYAKKPAPTVASHLTVPMLREPPVGPRSPFPVRQRGPESPGSSRSELDAQREADRITVHRFAPPGVLVNAELTVLQFRGPTGAFLVPPVGKASFDVLKMAREGLMLPLRSAISQAKKQNKTVRKANVRVERNGKTATINLEVVPLKNLRERCFLILFEDVEQSRGRHPGRGRVREPEPTRTLRSTRSEQGKRIAELETELSETREYLQSIQERYDASNEELQAANEEAQSANEELQSVNEELETSKEELESANEELTTINDEMADRNAELNRLNNDQANLQNSAKLAIVLLGRDLTIRRFSPQAEKQLNLRAADVGQPINHIRHDLAMDNPPPLDLGALAAEVIANVREQEHEVRDRGTRWYSLRVRPYITLENKVDGAVLVLVDITAVKQAQAAQASLAAIVACSDDAIISKDLRGVIQTWNQAAQRLFGYGADEAIGQPVTLIIPGDRAGEEPGILERVRRGDVVDHYETVRRRKDGSRLDISHTVSPIRDTAGRVIGAAEIARDITEQKRVERELQKYSSDLMQADLRKNEFLAMLGHELRNPVSVLAHGLDLQGKIPDDRTRSEGLRAMMLRQIARISTLLDQLLDIARVSSGKIELSRNRIDLGEVVRAAVETTRSLADTKHREFSIALPPEQTVFVMGDAVRLSQVVENLLTNALKYTDDGGQIRVTLETSSELARIKVSDDGIGMAAEFLPHVFEVFSQAPRSLDRAQGGLGLGMALSQRLIEMHGGHIDATSPGVGQGSEFIVTLPRQLESGLNERAAARAGPTGPGTTRPFRILVVDDEQDNADVLVDLLQEHGHKAVAVNGGQAALAAVRTFDPEVVLLDIGLPEMDGYEVARRLRDEYPNKRIFLIAVSGYQRDAARLNEAGFDQHLLKPLNINKLAAELAAWDKGETTPP